MKGFLNLSLTDACWNAALQAALTQPNWGHAPVGSKPQVMVEYSSPNTNKPLHLGHLRNNFLGYSVSRILEAAGHDVKKVQIINDRGIHICKSMVAWQKLGQGETPASTGEKGDKLVGRYYVAFDKAFKAEVAEGVANGLDPKEAEAASPMLQEARTMLQRWEEGDDEVVALWKTMNGWVYEGFDETYNAMGVSFDKLYYESDTYLLGKKHVEQGLADGVFFQKEDGSIWVDLTDDGLDEKLLLRGDGTAVYMTQDIGTAILRFADFPDLDRQVYTVGNEQEYHFKVLFLILKKLGFAQAEANHHLSYGMVELPEGKMKSREGTVVDADDLLLEMRDTARSISDELGKVDDFSEDDKVQLATQVGHGALKYFLLKVAPPKSMMFDPKSSIDFFGNTAPFIQFNVVRCKSILRNTGHLHVNLDVGPGHPSGRGRASIGRRRLGIPGRGPRGRRQLRPFADREPLLRPDQGLLQLLPRPPHCQRRGRRDAAGPPWPDRLGQRNGFERHGHARHRHARAHVRLSFCAATAAPCGDPRTPCAR